MPNLKFKSLTDSSAHCCTTGLVNTQQLKLNSLLPLKSHLVKINGHQRMLVKYRVTVCMFLFWEIDKMTLMTRVTFQTTVVSTLITYYLLKLILISKYDAFLSYPNTNHCLKNELLQKRSGQQVISGSSQNEMDISGFITCYLRF